LRRIAIAALVAFCAVGVAGAIVARAREAALGATIVPEDPALVPQVEAVIRSRLELLAGLHGASRWRMETAPGGRIELTLSGRPAEGLRELAEALVRGGRADFHVVASAEEIAAIAPEERGAAFFVAVERRSEWSLARPGSVQLSEQSHLLRARPEMSVSRFEGVDFRTEGLLAEPVIELAFLPADVETFAEVTGRCEGRRLALVVDGVVKAAAAVTGRVSGGRVELRGLRDRAGAERLAALLAIGALPCPCRLEFRGPRCTIQ